MYRYKELTVQARGAGRNVRGANRVPFVPGGKKIYRKKSIV